jgi:hypothetical protein
MWQYNDIALIRIIAVNDHAYIYSSTITAPLFGNH